MAGVAKEPVAFFDVFERASAEEEFQVQGGPLFIYPNWEFYIGRSPEWYVYPRTYIFIAADELSAYICGDPAVSNKHIHVTCIIFDEDTSVNNIPPLVYVQDFSTNGTYLKRPTSDPASAVEQLLSRRDGKILLGAGDQIRISPAIAFRFRYSGTVDPNFDRLPAAQRREAEVGYSGFLFARFLLTRNSFLQTDTPSRTRFLALVAMVMSLLPSTRSPTGSSPARSWICRWSAKSNRGGTPSMMSRMSGTEALSPA